MVVEVTVTIIMLVVVTVDDYCNVCDDSHDSCNTICHDGGNNKFEIF